jgi:hypothetical protein
VTCNLYCSGHDHSLNHIEWDHMHYIISGGGGAEMNGIFDPTVKSSAMEGLKFGSYSYGFTSFVANNDVLSVKMISVHGDELYQYSFTNPRVSAFNGYSLDYLLPTVSVLVILAACGFCFVYKCWTISAKITSPISEWKQLMLDKSTAASSTKNGTRGVFEILSDSDQDDDDDDESLEDASNTNKGEVVITFNRSLP